MRILLRLVRLSGPYKRHFAGAYLCMVGSVVFSLLIPYLVGSAINALVESHSMSRLLLLAGGILLASAARGLASYGQTYLQEAVSQWVAYDLRNTLYEKLQRLSFAYHDSQHTGNLMSRATADVEGVRRLFGFGLVRLAYLVSIIGAIAGILLALEWHLALVILLSVPLLVVQAIRTSVRLRRVWLRIQQVLADMTTVLQENLSGIRVVKAFGAEEYEKGRFSRKAEEVATTTVESERVWAFNSALMNLTFMLALAFVLWYGGRQVVAGGMTLGDLAKFVLYVGMIAFPMRMVGWIVNSFARAIPAGERIFEVLDAQSPVAEAPSALELKGPKGYLRFEWVSFTYDARAPVLREVSFEARPGQVVALLGAPGSGKSTVAHLVPRFYDITGGHITIDGVDIRGVSLASLRRNVGIVLQDVFLFSGTVQENIAYGAVNAPLERIQEAARIAQLHDFIMGLPEGYDTRLGERGVNLSGGQRQRLAIARTLLLDPPILILDDSTSSVDAQTESLIQQALENVMRGRTTIVIAHRLSTVKRADLILVLEEGRVVEQGVHLELLEKRGLYWEIYQHQLRPQEEAQLLRTLAARGGG